MKYMVVATVWNDEQKQQVKQVVGTFDKFHLAAIFRKAYNEEFNAHAEIIDTDKIVNG